MASKMLCPNCGKLLKEYGDESKSAKGEYIVYDSVATSTRPQGTSRILECLCCGMSDRIGRWIDFEQYLITLPMMLED